MRRIIVPGPRYFSSLEEFYDISDHSHHLVTGFNLFEDIKDYKAFHKACTILRYVDFAYTNNSFVLSELKLANGFNSTNDKNIIVLFYQRNMLAPTERQYMNG
jgi:hypothetical protein